MLQELKKDFKQIIELIKEEDLISSADIRELNIDKMSFKKLNIASRALFIFVKNYFEQKEMEYYTKDNNDLLKSARTTNYCLQEMNKALKFMERIVLIRKKCSVYANKGGL